MAKRKRGSYPDDTGTQNYSSVSRSGFREVDRIIKGGESSTTIVRNFGITGRRFLPMPKVSKIKQARNFNKLPSPSCTDSNMEDHIRRLPVNILMFIISLLTMREGAATSILSSQWRKLWSTSVSCLDFDDSNVIGYKYPSNYFHVKEEEFLKKNRYICTMRANRILQRRRLKKKGCLESERAKFIRRVNRIWRSILQNQRASALRSLRVSFPMGKESTPHLDKWMKLAAAQGVTQLELDFNFIEFDCLISGDEYKFPVQEFGSSSLSYLRLKFCVFDIPPNFKGFNSLISLSLHDTLLMNNSVQNMLTNCPSLEWLSLRDCKFSNPSILKIVGPSVILKHLDISHCNIKEIELQDVNVLSFELQSYRTKLSMINLRRLARLVLDTNSPVEILSNVPHIKTLFLTHGEAMLPKLSVFNNLKLLVFSANYHKLFDVFYFLKACPLLQQLELDMGFIHRFNGWYTDLTEEETRMTVVPECPHDNLKKVLMYAFVGHPEQIKLAKCLLKNALVLEKMEIYTSCKSYCGNGFWSHARVTAEPGGLPLKDVHRMLQKEARSSTEVILALND